MVQSCWHIPFITARLSRRIGPSRYLSDCVVCSLIVYLPIYLINYIYYYILSICNNVNIIDDSSLLIFIMNVCYVCMLGYRLLIKAMNL